MGCGRRISGRSLRFRGTVARGTAGAGTGGGDKPGPVAERERVVEFLGGTIVSQSDASVTDTVENKFKSRRPYRCCRQNIFAFYMESQFSCHFTRPPTGAGMHGQFSWNLPGQWKQIVNS